ncbi:hypothetical protein PIB30_094577 [Stylosanthes scabra]|uniref:DUF4283 domain-containing protein n=1 Tax=Stylosanthes scabra TaxID=79078 RepID=A0ABU6WWF9_9FABA|nr:hypothetical protein [Stylosanthes scabra]
MATSANNSQRPFPSAAVDEETVIVLETAYIHRGLERCSKSLIDRLLFYRSFSGSTIESALQSIWRRPEGFKVLDHGGNKYQFFFYDEKDLIKIERGSSWLFKNFILNLKCWQEETPFEDADFIHVRGLESSIIKAKFWLNVTKPLRRSLKIDCPNQKNFTISGFGSSAIIVATLAMKFEITASKLMTLLKLEFVFASRKDSSQISSPQPSLKQQARKEFKRIVGVKRNSIEIKDGQCYKKQCSEDNFTTVEGEGATPQWAPNDQ